MISVLLLFYNLTRLLSGGLHTRHSHSPSWAVSSPSQARWSHSSHNSHWIMSSQHSGLEHEQNSLMSQFCLLLNLGVALSRGKGSKRPLSKHFTKCSRIFPCSKETYGRVVSSGQLVSESDGKQATVNPYRCTCAGGSSTARVLPVAKFL